MKYHISILFKTSQVTIKRRGEVMILSDIRANLTDSVCFDTLLKDRQMFLWWQNWTFGSSVKESIWNKSGLCCIARTALHLPAVLISVLWQCTNGLPTQPPTLPAGWWPLSSCLLILMEGRGGAVKWDLLMRKNGEGRSEAASVTGPVRDHFKDETVKKWAFTTISPFKVKALF